MSENDTQSQPTGIRTSMKVLTVVLVTVGVTYLYAGSDLAMTKTPESTGTILYRAKDADTAVRGRGKIMAVTTVTTTTVTNDGQKKALGTDMKANVAWEPMLDDRSVVGDLQVVSRSRDVLSTHDIAVSKNGTPLAGRGEGGGEGPNSINDNRYQFEYRSDDNREAVDSDTDSKTNGYRSKTQNPYYTALENTQAASEGDTSTDYVNVNNVFVNEDDSGYKDGEITKKRFKWIANDRQREQIYTGSPVTATLTESASGSFGQASNIFKPRRPIGHDINYRPPVTVPGKTHQPFEDVHKLRSPQSNRNKISWKNIGVLALIKLVFLKLQTIGFFQYMFILGFKLKLFIIAMLFKFVLLLKLVKIFKILILPLFFWSFLPILTSKFNRTNNTQSSNAFATQSGLGSLSNAFGDGGSQTSAGSQSSSFSSSFFSGFVPVNFFPDFLSSIIGPPSFGDRFHRDLSPGNGTGFQNETRSPVIAHKLNGSEFFNKQHEESLRSFGRTLSMSQRVLDSEKCVDRIAKCWIAVADKTGIIPVSWMHMMLSGLSKLILGEKLESYFKTYSDVIHEVYSKLSLADDWVKWCSERYGCNAKNVTAVTGLYN